MPEWIAFAFFGVGALILFIFRSPLIVIYVAPLFALGLAVLFAPSLLILEIVGVAAVIFGLLALAVRNVGLRFLGEALLILGLGSLGLSAIAAGYI